MPVLRWRQQRDLFPHDTIPGIVRERYGGEPASLRFISQDYNIVYRFERAGRGAYLRICHIALHSLAKSRQVNHFLRFLAAEDVPVGRPLPALSGDYVLELPGGFTCAAQSEAPGEKITGVMQQPVVCEAWGYSLGRLHASSSRYLPDPAIPYAFPTVQQFWQNIAPVMQQAPAPLPRIYAKLSAEMDELPREDMGLIHGDYRPGNVLWDGRCAHSIDFDEPNIHWYIADVARALLELWPLPLKQRRRCRRAFMRGYRRARPIDVFWERKLPFFAQHRALLMHGWTLQEGGSGSYSRAWALERRDW